MVAHDAFVFLNRRSCVRPAPGALKNESDRATSCAGAWSCATRRTRASTTAPEGVSCESPDLLDARGALLGLLWALVEQRVTGCTKWPRIAEAMRRLGQRRADELARVAVGVDLGPCPRPVRPCLCGHGAAMHWEDWGCEDPTCGCSRWTSPGNRERGVNPGLSTSASCLDDCTCGAEHAAGTAYYVTCTRTRTGAPGIALLLGPYASHSVALAMVDTARRLAMQVDVRAAWYAYGTIGWDGTDDPPLGKLNEMLRAEELEAETKPVRARRRKGLAA